MTQQRLPTFLDDVLVVELGQRLGAGICGSLLAEAGAEVVNIEVPYWIDGVAGKQHACATLNAGKTNYEFSEHRGGRENGNVGELIAGADIVIVSSDTDPEWLSNITRAIKACPIICDIVGLEADPKPSDPYKVYRKPPPPPADPQVQALAGAMDTSGEPDGPPALCAAPIVEMSAALYAASGVIATLRAARLQRRTQKVSVSLYNVAVGMLATFLPKNFAGGNAQRVGNHHPAMSPWNAFAAKDGWVLLCAGTNDQWTRVAKLIGRPDLAADPRFGTTTKRVAGAAEVDATIAPWIKQFTVAECVDKLNAISISTGPILEVGDLAREPNLAHRGMVRTLADGTTRVPGSPLRGSAVRGVAAEITADNSTPFYKMLDKARLRVEMRHRGENSFALGEAIAKGRGIADWNSGGIRNQILSKRPGKPSLAGVRVIEMGQFTTAPLVGRQLGALGADVIKLEPNGGEPAREMPPHKNGQGFFFSLSNSDTRVMTLDLRDPGRVGLLTKLIEKADVLVENTKPGTLPRHGFTPERILEINPRIVYCAISGFGIDAPSAGLGAMDTTIQGLAGIMDLTRVDGVPYKTGISIADLHAGQFALFATLAALEFRDRTGKGQVIDLAMLDAAAWVTRTTWNGSAAVTAAEFELLAARDGHILVRLLGQDPRPCYSIALDKVIEGGLWNNVKDRIQAAAKVTDRKGILSQLDELGIEAVPVMSVAEVLADPRTKERGLIFEAKAPDGSTWNLLKCPIQLSRTPAEVRRVPGPLDADRDEILRDWKIDWRAPA